MVKEALYEESATSLKSKKESKFYMAFQVIAIIFAVCALLYTFLCVSMIIPTTIAQYKNPPEGVQRLSKFGLILNIVMRVSMIAVLALTSFLFFRFRRRFNVSYDYLFVEDELRITKVFNGRKRKHLITMKAESMLQIGYCENDSFERLLRGNGKPKFMTPNQEPMDEKTFIYILYSSQAGKSLYVLECRQMMLEYVVRAAGRNKFERQ